MHPLEFQIIVNTIVLLNSYGNKWNIKVQYYWSIERGVHR